MTIILKDDWSHSDPFGTEEDDHPENGIAIAASFFANAVQVWAICTLSAPTVANAALAFNCQPEVIRHAVEVHPWMYLSGDDDDPNAQTIEHDGE